MKLPAKMWIAEWDMAGSRARDIYWSKKKALAFGAIYANLEIYSVIVSNPKKIYPRTDFKGSKK